MNTLGILSLGSGGGSSTYTAFTGNEIDRIGLRKLAEANDIPVEGEKGEIKFPTSMAPKMKKPFLLPFTITEIEKEGWEFISVTSDHHYLFRKR